MSNHQLVIFSKDARKEDVTFYYKQLTQPANIN